MIQEYMDGWEAIQCSELVTPNVDGKGSLFPTSETFTKFPYEDKAKQCQAQFNRTPNYDFIFEEFGGQNYVEDFKNYSNILFVNGAMDPWLDGCLQK